MNMLRKLAPLRLSCTRLLETTVAPAKNIIVEPLSDRELIRVEGEEVQQFLQGLITNDIKHLTKTNNSMYSLFLNKAGRVLYDTFIYRTTDPNTYIIECDKCVTAELKRHLRLYRVRRKINIDNADELYTPWIAFNPDEASIDHKNLSADWFFTTDPRLKELGLRVLMTPDKSWVDLAKLFAKTGEVGINVPTTDCNYRWLRYRYGVGEGVNDLPPGKCFALESNCDFLHGVSFQKGCYIGQELTARSYHTGIVRKRLMPIRLTSKVTESGLSVQLLGGKNIGSLRGTCHNRGLGLVRLEHALNDNEFLVDGEICYIEKPHWWPKELRFKANVGGFQ